MSLVNNIGVLSSTRATDLASVVEAANNGSIPAKISLLVSDKKDASCLEKAKSLGIESMYINKKNFSSREQFDRAIAKEFDKREIGFVACIGYMRFLSPWFVRKYKNRVLNVHPSLLPAFPGMDLDVHKAVLSAGCKVSGCTVHLVDEGKDTGPIVLQKTVPVFSSDTPELLKERVQKAEQEILPLAVKAMVENRIFVEGKIAWIKG